MPPLEPSKLTSSRTAFARRLRRWCLRVDSLVQIDAPEVIVAHAVTHLMVAAIGYCGHWFWTEFGRIAFGYARSHYGYCQTCDTERPREESEHFVCEACDKKEMAEYDDMIRGSGVDFDDPSDPGGES